MLSSMSVMYSTWTTYHLRVKQCSRRTWCCSAFPAQAPKASENCNVAARTMIPVFRQCNFREYNLEDIASNVYTQRTRKQPSTWTQNLFSYPNTSKCHFNSWGDSVVTSQCAPQYCSISVRMAKLNHACSSDERKRFPTVHDDTSGVTFALIMCSGRHSVWICCLYNSSTLASIFIIWFSRTWSTYLGISNNDGSRSSYLI